MEHYLAGLDFDIGIAPLARTEFNASKSWAKLLEYGARGIPAVATRWGQYPEWFRLPGDDPPGILVDDPTEIPDALAVLSDHDTRARMGSAARERAAMFTTEGNTHRWADALRWEPP